MTREFRGLRGGYMGLHGVTRVNKGVTGGCQRLQGVRKGYR